MFPNYSREAPTDVGWTSVSWGRTVAPGPNIASVTGLGDHPQARCAAISQDAQDCVAGLVLAPSSQAHTHFLTHGRPRLAGLTQGDCADIVTDSPQCRFHGRSTVRSLPGCLPEGPVSLPQPHAQVSAHYVALRAALGGA